MIESSFVNIDPQPALLALEIKLLLIIHIMSESDRILEQLKRTFYKEAWHGPAFLEILDGVTAEQASKHSIANAHSIWEIVLHTKTWIEAVRIRSLGK